MSFSSRLGVIAAFAAVLLLAGCGGTVVDDLTLEETVGAYLEKSQDEKLESIDCPSDEPVDPGLVIRCDVTLKGGDQKIVAIEIVNEDADIKIASYREAQ